MTSTFSQIVLDPENHILIQTSSNEARWYELSEFPTLIVHTFLNNNVYFLSILYAIVAKG